MTNEDMDEFDQDDVSLASKTGGGRAAGVKDNLVTAWRTRPLFKLLVIMGMVGTAVGASLVVTSSPTRDLSSISKATAPPNLKEAPGGAASPFFLAQNQMANDQRVDQALQDGGSALPTPVGQVDIPEAKTKKEDPLVEFRAEAENLKEQMRREKQQNVQTLQKIQEQLQRQQAPVQTVAPPAEDTTLARAMQKQMSELMEQWGRSRMVVVGGTELKEAKEALFTQGQPAAAPLPASLSPAEPLVPVKSIVQAGTVNYAQLMTEANSDIQAPILAQVLSGPLAGGRAIGHFQVVDDYLVMTFNLVNYKGKDYAVNAMALDPGTTLSGVVTDVDNRYLTRVLLPAAAQFASVLGNTLGQTPTTTNVTSGGAVVVTQAQQGFKQGLYSGAAQVGQTLSQFLQDKASRTKPLVRAAVGTPVGLFFLSSVLENGAPPANALVPQGVGSPFPLSGAGMAIPGMPQTPVSGYGYGANGGYAPAGVAGGGWPTSLNVSGQKGVTILQPNQSGGQGVAPYGYPR